MKQPEDYAPTVMTGYHSGLIIVIAAKRIYLRQRYRFYRTAGLDKWEARAYAQVDFSRRQRFDQFVALDQDRPTP
jgi:hypothetical protein